MSRTNRKEKTKCNHTDELHKKRSREYKQKRRKGIVAEIAILLICVMMLIPGCLVIWTDDAFVYTFAKTVDANDLSVVVNKTKIGSGQTKTKNDKIKAITPYGVVETND
jgi:hypothetical protein